MISLQQRVMDRIEYVAARRAFDVVSLPGGYANVGVLAIQPRGTFITAVSIRYDFQAGSVTLDARRGEVHQWEFAGGTRLSFNGEAFAKAFAQWEARLGRMLDECKEDLGDA